MGELQRAAGRGGGAGRGAPPTSPSAVCFLCACVTPAPTNAEEIVWKMTNIEHVQKSATCRGMLCKSEVTPRLAGRIRLDCRLESSYTWTFILEYLREDATIRPRQSCTAAAW